jgi:hypothetical protein
MPKKLTNIATRATSKGLGKKSSGPDGLKNTAKRSTSKTTGAQGNDRKFGKKKTTSDLKQHGGNKFGKGGGY